MCGLFGAMGPVPNRKQIVAHLSLLNMERGKDSTGYAEINTKTGQSKILKCPTSAKTFLPYLNLAQDDLLIGHTRHATSGRINKSNAHPWRIGNIVGCHNGVLFNEFEVWEYLHDNGEEANYEVDSQYLLHMHSCYGHNGVASGMLNLTYWDELKNALVIQCYKNPLCLAIADDYSWLCWSSEIEHLEYALSGYKTEDYTLYDMKEEVHVWTPGKTLWVETDKVKFDEEAYSKYDNEYDKWGYRIRDEYDFKYNDKAWAYGE